MGRTQRLILAGGLAAALLAAAIPPWRGVGTNPGGNTYDIPAGYGLAVRPPSVDFPQRGQIPPERLRIDAGLLLAELAAIGAATGLALLGAAARATGRPVTAEPGVAPDRPR